MGLQLLLVDVEKEPGPCRSAAPRRGERLGTGHPVRRRDPAAARSRGRRIPHRRGAARAAPAASLCGDYRASRLCRAARAAAQRHAGAAGGRRKRMAASARDMPRGAAAAGSTRFRKPIASRCTGERRNGCTPPECWSAPRITRSRRSATKPLTRGSRRRSTGWRRPGASSPRAAGWSACPRRSCSATTAFASSLHGCARCRTKRARRFP